MDYKPREIKAKVINDRGEWTILKAMGLWTLVYAKRDFRTTKTSSKGEGIAFGSIATLREVATELLKIADRVEGEQR
jgi:hypothetical protein